MTSDRVAVDTCVLVNIMTGGKADEADWFEASTAIMRAADRGEYRLAISALVIAELAGTGAIRGKNVPVKTRSARIGKVRSFMARAGYLIVETDARTADRAAELAINHQLFGPDAIVLASALHSKAKILYTWDKQLLKLNGQFPFQILKPSDSPGGVQLDLFSGAAHAAVV
jgi:predicted nucleic acid-binding protein